MFLLSENSFVTSSECSVLFLFLAVFKILFQVSTHFVASKIRGTEKDCDLPEELLSHSHSSGVYKVGIISVLPNCSMVVFDFSACDKPKFTHLLCT